MKKENLYQLFILWVIIIITYLGAYNKGRNSVLDKNVLLIKMYKNENTIKEKVYKSFYTLQECEVAEKELSKEKEIYYCLEK